MALTNNKRLNDFDHDRIQLIQKGYFYTVPLKIGQLMYNGATSCLKCNGRSQYLKR